MNFECTVACFKKLLSYRPSPGASKQFQWNLCKLLYTLFSRFKINVQKLYNTRAAFSVSDRKHPPCQFGLKNFLTKAILITILFCPHAAFNFIVLILRLSNSKPYGSFLYRHLKSVVMICLQQQYFRMVSSNVQYL